MIRIFTGNEPYLIDYEVSKIAGSNSPVYEELTDSVIASCMTYPLFGASQAVVVKPEKLPDEGKLQDIMKSVPEFTNLLIVPKTVDKRKKEYQTAAKKGFIKECNKVDQGRLCKLLVQLITAQGGKITQELLDYMVKQSGYLLDDSVNLYSMNMWIKQMCFSSEIITKQDIDCFVPESDQTKIFALSGAILSGDGEKTIKMAKKFIAEKQEPIAMLSLLLRSFRLGYKANLLKNKNEKEIEKEIGVSMYQIGNVRQYETSQIEMCMDALAKGVTQIKSGAKGEMMFYKTLSDLLEILA